jgi:hypothetical protein
MAGTLVVDTLQTGTGTNISTGNIASGIAKAWGVITWTSGGSAVLAKGFNIASMTKTTANAVPVYRLTFTTPMSDINYSVVLGAGQKTAGGSGYFADAYPSENIATTGFSIVAFDNNWNADTPTNVRLSFAVYN